MFKGRRHRAATGPSPLGARTPPVNTVAAANSAALQAFMASQNATKLSAAAAATAVRSHTPPPTNVGDVRTKRMQRRTSISSNASAPASTSVPQRRGSAGSMSERTFREQSPGRAGSKAITEDLPPLPSVPKALSSTSKKQPRRPPSDGIDEHVSSAISTGPSTSPTPKQRKLRVQTSPAPEPPASPTPGGRSSVNFSRPISPSSPPASPTFSKRNSKKSALDGAAPSSGPVITTSEAEQISHSVLDAGMKPVKKKKKAVAPGLVEGSHLQAGTTSGGKPTGAALGAAAAAAALSGKGSSASSSTSTLKTKKSTTGGETRDIAATGRTSEDSTFGATEPSRASGTLVKQPSVVHEDREGERLAEKGLDPNALRHSNGNPGRIRNSSSEMRTAEPISSPKLELDTSARSKRESVSPGRAARFAGVALEPPVHKPPGRSASPSKSAMKQSPSPRNISPSDMRSQAWNRPGFTPSEVSDTPSATSEDVRRKKRISRVSFDVEPTIVGQAAEVPAGTDSPVMASPQNEKASKRNWFSFGREKGKMQPTSNEVDEVIQPVPTLPSFGSVRGKRDSLVEEREPSPARALPRATSARAKHVTKAPSPEIPQATSEESAPNVPDATAQTAVSESTEPTHDPNAPLAPEVTSVEGSGHYDYSDQEGNNSETANDTVTPPDEATLDMTASEKSENNGTAMPVDVGDESTTIPPAPTIELQPATPAIEDPNMRDGYMDALGGSEKEIESSVKANGVVPDGPGATLDASADQDGNLSESTSSHVVRTETPIVKQTSSGNESDSSGTSEYRDAEEYDGDGFGSINAIVESPMIDAKNSGTSNTRNESPTAEKSSSSQDRTASGPAKAQMPLKSALKKDKDNSTVVNAPGESTATTSGAPSASTATKSSQKQTTMRKSMRDASPMTSTSPNRMRASMRTPDTRVGPMRMMSTPTPAKTISASIETTPSPPKASVIEAGTRERDSARNTAIPVPSTTGGRLQKKQRPLSVLQAATTPLPASTQSRARPVSMGADGRIPRNDIPAVPIPSKKFAGYDSDSDSSFKRAKRPARASSESRVSMRRSMRTTPPQQTRKDPRTTNFGTPQSSNPRPSSMRTTMRTAQSPPVPERKRSRTPTRSLFSRTSKGPPIPTEPVPSVTPRFKSRFADSDSDDDATPARAFRSRFADSSDEDEPAGLDVLAIARSKVTAKASASTSNINDLARAADTPERASSYSKDNALTAKTLRSGGKDKESTPDKRPGSPTFSSFSQTRDGEKRKSILGNFSFGRRKDRGSKVAKVEIGSASRRDTPTERSQATQQNIPAIATPSTSTVDQIADMPTPTPASKVAVASNAPTPSRPMSPPRSASRLLQRRKTSEGWPAPPPEPPSSPPPLPRPLTSDGMSKRTSLGARILGGSRPTTPPGFRATMRTSTIEKQQDAGENEAAPDTPLSATASTQKRKRFQGLRKAFRMKD